MKKNYTFIILLAIVIFGASLRFYKLGNNSFVADEFLDINSSYAYAKTGEWKNWDFNFGKINEENAFAARDERAWIYKWQVAELFKVFPPTEGTVRTISVLWGIISIILMYFITKDFTKNKTIGLIAAFLFAISLDGIEFDRKLRMYAMFFPVFLAFSWSLFSFLEKTYAGKNKFLEKIWNRWEINLAYLIPALILAFLSLNLHLLTANIAVILALYVLIFAIIKIKRKEGYKNKYAIFFSAGFLILLAGLISVPSQLAVAIKELGFTSHFSYIQRVLSDYQVPVLAIIFLLLGIYYLWKKSKMEKSALWLSLSLLATLVLAIFFWKRNSGSQYIFFVQSFKIILISCGIYFAATFAKENLTKWRKKPFWISLILVLIILPNFAYFFQKNNPYNQNSRSDNPNYRSIFAYFKKKKTPTDVLVTRNFRNYYYSGANVKVFDFGGEISNNKLTLSKVQQIMADNPTGWIILSDNDDVYISKEAQDYIQKNLVKINEIAVRGQASVYRWGN
jgi:hypothetical protein